MTQKVEYVQVAGFLTDKGARGAAAIYRKYGMTIKVEPFKNHEGVKVWAIMAKAGTTQKLMSNKSMKGRIHKQAHDEAYKAVHGHYYDSYDDNPYNKV
jgi:hypothetical protein